MKRLRLFTPLLCLLALLPGICQAASVTQVVRIIDSAGNPVSGATIAVGATTLTAGSAATTLGAINLATGGALTNQTLTYYDANDGTGEYLFRADPATNELHFAVTITKGGVVIATPVVGLNFYADPSSIAGTYTRVGLALPAVAAGANGGLPIGNGSGQVTVVSNLDKTGYTASVVSDKTGYSLAASEHTAISGTDVPTAMAAQGYTPTLAANIGTTNTRVDAAVSTRLATSGYTAAPTAQQNADAHWNALTSAYTGAGTMGLAQTTAATQATAAATSAAAAVTAISSLPTNSSIATAVTNAVLAASIDGTLTFKQAECLQVAIMTGKYTTSTSGGVTTTNYFKQDGTTLIATSTVSTTAGATTRTWSFVNLP